MNTSYGTPGLPGWFGFFFVVAVLFNVVFWGVVIWAIISLVGRRNSAPPPPPGYGYRVPPQATPQSILAERLARGEIDSEEYALRLDALRRGSSPP